MKKSIFEIALLLGLSLSLTVGALAKEEQTNISEELIRLHIVANSDSEFDQSVKLSARDEIVEYISELTKKCKNKEEATVLLKEHLDVLEEISDRVCKANGVSYSSSAKILNMHFPAREYDSFSLPAGRYDALRIELGTAEGQNWWCVLFPPLCIDAATCESKLKQADLSKNEVLLVTSDKPQYQLKFKILEVLNKFC